MTDDSLNNSLIETRDGSHSIFSKQFNASYHSVFGAIDESLHVFINQGLKPLIKNPKTDIVILEIGFGTGLNALLTLREVIDKSITVNYHTVEFFPVPNELVSQLNYVSDMYEEKLVFSKMHLQAWDTTEQLRPNFYFTKYLTRIENFKTDLLADLIYFDAFSPSHQPELWTTDIFKNMFQMLKPAGQLVTYCAQGQMKRNMKAAGFTVKALKGFANKREMTLAIKQNV